MKRAVSLLICLGAIALGALIGWRLRARRAEAAPSTAPTAAGRESSAGTGIARSATAAAAAEMAARFAVSTGAERWLLLLTRAENATASDMPGLLRLAAGNETMGRVLATRWAALDPRHMFDSLITDLTKNEHAVDAADLFSVLITEWMARDPAAAIAALTSASNLPGMNPLFIEQRRSEAVSIMMKSDPARAIALMSEWNIRHHLPNLAPLEKWLAESPERAAGLAGQIDLKGASEEVLRTLGKSWAKNDPAAALAFAGNLPLAQRAAFTGGAMKDWARQDLQSAAAFVAAQTDPAYRGHLAGPLIEAWAATDPQAAFAWSQENLKGAARVQSISNVVNALAGRSPEEAAAMVNGLESGQTKFFAASALLEYQLKTYDPIRPDPATRDAALALLATINDKEAARQALAKSAWKLFTNAPDAAQAFLSGPHADIAPSELWGRTAGDLAKQNPEGALQWAATVPAEYQRTAMASLMSSWVSNQPEAARTRVLAMPSGDQRNLAMGEVVRQALYSADPKTTTWIRDLPAADRTLARGIIDTATLPEDRRATLLEAVK